MASNDIDALNAIVNFVPPVLMKSKGEVEQQQVGLFLSLNAQQSRSRKRMLEEECISNEHSHSNSALSSESRSNSSESISSRSSHFLPMLDEHQRPKGQPKLHTKSPDYNKMLARQKLI